jgi:hypothetical protein
MPIITRENAAQFRRPLVRPEPAGPPGAYKTYSITAPLDTHWRVITCEEAACPAHEHGFRIAVDDSGGLGAQQAGYIRTRSGRPFRESREAGLAVFTFPAGTQCFTRHQSRRSRPPLFVVRGGDWRAQIGRAKVHTSPENWVDDMRTHQDRLATQLGR